MKQETSAQPPAIRSSRLICAALRFDDQFAVGADALEDRGPEPGLVGAALGRRHGVAIGLEEAVARGRPVDRPFDLARGVEFLGEIHGAREGLVGIGGGGAEGFPEIIGKAAGEVKAGLGRGLAVVDMAFPADLDAREEIGLGARHIEEARGLERQVAEDLGVGVEGDGGAAPVRRGAEGFDWALRDAAREFLGVKLAVAGNLDPEMIGEGVDDADPDAVQAARGLIGLAGELAARV